MTSIVGVIKRFWVVLIVLLAVVVAILVVTRLRGFFGTDLPASARWRRRGQHRGVQPQDGDL